MHPICSASPSAKALAIPAIRDGSATVRDVTLDRVPIDPADSRGHPSWPQRVRRTHGS
jgi:hypothetical protein